MKRLLIGALVGGIIIFIWQTLSFVLLDLHSPAHQYTSKQDEIMNYLSSQLTQNGQYFLPTHPEGATQEQVTDYMKNAEGKPWAIISYHTSWDTDMTMNMVRGLLVNIIMVGLLCWIISKMNLVRFSTILTASLFVGLISFLNVPYTNHIWYETFDLMAYLIDALLSWGLAGLWLGYWYGRDLRR